jgi:hypothetical protein
MGTTFRITLCVSARALSALLLVGALGLMFSACGGDDDDESDRSGETTPTVSTPPPVTTPPPEVPGTGGGKKDPDEEPRTVPPEEQQGDEEPIRSEAVFTGRGGRLTPREIRVPAFIAIRVILRSPDADQDQGYSLEIGGQRLAIGHTAAIDEINLDGLLPDESYEGKSPQGNVRIVASAEPGP